MQEICLLDKWLKAWNPCISNRSGYRLISKGTDFSDSCRSFFPTVPDFSPLLSFPLLSFPLVFLISRLRTNNALSTTTTATTPAGNTVYRQDIAFFARSIFFLLRITELISRIDWRANKRDNFGLDSVLEFIFMMEWNKLRDSHFLRCI